MERFLRSSLEKERRIRAVLMLEGKLVQKPVTVLALEGGQVTLRLSAKRAPITVPLDAIYSCDYARGDHGEE